MTHDGEIDRIVYYETMESDLRAGKPLTRTQRARRDDIITATIIVLDQEGFAAASVERIAQVARATKSTVLYHFDTKDAIYHEVVRILLEQAQAALTKTRDPASPAAEQLRTYLDLHLRFIAVHAAHVNAVRQILMNQSADYQLPDSTTEIRQILTNGQVFREFGEFDADVMAMVIRSIIDGFSAHWGDAATLDHRIDEIVALFARATKPYEPSDSRWDI